MRVLIFTCLFFGFSIGAFASQNKKQVKLRVQAANGNLDQTTIYFDGGIYSNFSSAEDAQKVSVNLAGIPVIYSISADNFNCSTNGYSDLTQTEEIALGVDVDQDGIYSISAVQVDNFDATTVLRLEDRQLNMFIDLRTNFYQTPINANDPEKGRFYLHVSRAAKFNTTSAGCANNDAILSVNQDNSIAWDLCELYDASNNLVDSFSAATGQFDFGDLASGDYTVKFTLGDYVATKEFTLTSYAIASNINVGTSSAFTGEDITFHAEATNTNHYEWNFGEGTLILGVANPTVAFYEPGTYTVNLKCTNDHGCQSSADIEFTVAQAISTGINDVDAKTVNVYATGKSIIVNLNNEVNKGAQISVFNLLGQSIYNNPLSSTITTVSFDEQPAGYYLVAIKNGGKTNTKRVFLGQ